MSNIETVTALHSAIDHDRFGEIEALHNPGAKMYSFRGPTVSGSVAIGDWYREFLRDYADCRYTDATVLEAGDSVAARATLLAKSVDWREFSQRIVEVSVISDGGVSMRRIYAMPAGVEYPKAANDAIKRCDAATGGSASGTAKIVQGFFDAVVAGDNDAAKALLDDKGVVVDGVFGIAVGPDNILELLGSLPRPAFGRWRVAGSVAAAVEAVVELTIDPARPRLAGWVRVVDEKVVMVEAYWMLREIGVSPAVDSLPRHPKQVILPI